MGYRVTPELKSGISSGNVNLTAIVNTHQYGLPTEELVMCSFADIE